MSRSVATIDPPEFLNIQPLNPLISQCEIKVLYVGQNRNDSFISKAVATAMADSLPGCPIVGYYKPDNQDFGDHGERMILDGDGISFECLTKPYGFIGPNAEVWFQKFDDTEPDGTVTTHEYLMTTGYLWTGQFPEVQRVVDEGNNQSMELDKESLQGNWAIDDNSGIEFLIINDAIFSKLCILGEDVEPCFEGSTITGLQQNVSTSFSKIDDNFKTTLFSMMQELQSALTKNEGGLNMDKELVEEEVDFAKGKTKTPVAPVEDDGTKPAPTEKESTEPDPATTTTDPVPPKKKKATASLEDDKTKCTLDAETIAAYELLKTQYAALVEERDSLLAFKNTIDGEKKDELINSFTFLTDEDKADVVANKATYTLDEIESKLCVKAVRNKVSFNLDEQDVNSHQKSAAVTFNLDSTTAGEEDAIYSGLVAYSNKEE